MAATSFQAVHKVRANSHADAKKVADALRSLSSRVRWHHNTDTFFTDATRGAVQLAAIRAGVAIVYVEYLD